MEFTQKIEVFEPNYESIEKYIQEKMKGAKFDIKKIELSIDLNYDKSEDNLEIGISTIYSDNSTYIYWDNEALYQNFQKELDYFIEEVIDDNNEASRTKEETLQNEIYSCYQNLKNQVEISRMRMEEKEDGTIVISEKEENGQVYVCIYKDASYFITNLRNKTIISRVIDYTAKVLEYRKFIASR